MWFFVFSINFARTREGRPARRKLTELLVKSKKTLVTEPAAIFFVFQVNISCKTTSIILYFKYASFSVVTRKKRQNTNPHPDGNFFDDRFGLGILRDAPKHITTDSCNCQFLRNHVVLYRFVEQTCKKKQTSNPQHTNSLITITELTASNRFLFPKSLPMHARKLTDPRISPL